MKSACLATINMLYKIQYKLGLETFDPKTPKVSDFGKTKFG